MGYFWSVEGDIPPGLGFERFGPGHIALLALSALIITGLCLLCRRLGAAGRRRLRLGLAAAALASELFRTGMLLAAGAYDVYSLPLHLCGLAVFFTGAHALRGGVFLGELLWCFCMPGAAAALLFPDWTAYPLCGAMSLNAFFVHTLLTAYPAMLTAAGELRPRARRLSACFCFMLAVAGAVFVFNKLTGTNYFFLNWPAPGSPLSWFAGFLGRPGYILGYLPMLAAVWAALYIPSRKNDRAPK